MLHKQPRNLVEQDVQVLSSSMTGKTTPKRANLVSVQNNGYITILKHGRTKH